MLVSSPLSKKLKLWDNIFRRVIILAGVATIICVLAILWSILKISIPLFKTGAIEKTSTPTFANRSPLLYVTADEFLENVWGLSKTGELVLQNLNNPEIQKNIQITNAEIKSIESASPNLFLLKFPSSATELWFLGSIKEFSETGNKTYNLRHEKLASFPILQKENFQQGDIFYDAARRRNENSFARVVATKQKKIYFYWQESVENFLGEAEVVLSQDFFESSLKGEIVASFFSRDAKHFYLADDKGDIEVWDLRDLESIQFSVSIKTALSSQIEKPQIEKLQITSLNTIYGDTSLLVGFNNGSVEIFAFTRGSLQKIYSLQTESGKIQNIIPSLRNKSFLVVGEKNSSFWYLTATQKILQLDWQKLDWQKNERIKIAFNKNGTALTTLDKGKISIWKIDAPHPDFSLRASFSKIQYEGYPEPDYIWQSSSGNDDFEPKFNFIPLIIGSLKGTLYAMIFALPLAIFGAIYINQFAKPWVRNVVKPTIEIMASIPSVVIGFLAALWLAPLIEKYLLAILLYLVFFPLFFLFCFFIFQKFFKKFMKKDGKEFLFVMPAFIICALFIAWFAPFLSQQFFSEDFIFWLSEKLGLVYEQRNAIVISFALGFAIIPIIFTMTDEALSSFPKNLTAASLALGANHWQTLVRVILPTTASGIFAGFIIGFGRAIGETMIVLMATGNSPITSWSIFNGMRTLSANIAVEVPEAPFEETLYRVLFLSGVMLFLFTFLLNFIAEIIRSRLRKKYHIH